MEFNETFLVSIISFLLFVFIMNMVFYRPISKIVEERKQFVDENYEDAKKAQEQSEHILSDIDTRKGNAFSEAKSILIKQSNEAKSRKDKLTQEAKNNSLSTIQDAKSKLNEENENSKTALNQQIDDLADTICKKLNESR